MNEDEIRTEAVRMATRQMELQAEKEYKEALKRQKEAEEAQVNIHNYSLYKIVILITDKILVKTVKTVFFVNHKK